MTVYGYARVSSRVQLDGTSLEQQETLLKSAGAERIIKEQFTGTKKNRPLFKELIDSLEVGDTLIVTKLDRFARSTIDALTTIEELNKRNVGFIVLDLNGQKLDTSNPNSELLVTILCAFAKFERDMIVQRTREGKAIAKQNPNFKEGRPKKYTQYQLDEAMKLLETMSFAQVEREMNRRGTMISMSTLKRESKRRKVMDE